MGETQPAEQPLPADDETTAAADAQQQPPQPPQPSAPDGDGGGIKPANRYDG